MISRRSLFGFLAAAPVGAVAAVNAAAQPALTPMRDMTAYEAYQRYQEAVAKRWPWQYLPMTDSELAALREANYRRWKVTRDMLDDMQTKMMLRDYHACRSV